MKRSDLFALTKLLESAFLPVVYFEAFEDKRGYNIGKQFPLDLYKRGIQRQLEDHWRSAPSVYTLDDHNYNFSARTAGCEWAALLRARDPNAVILRVYAKDRYAGAPHILCQLLSSLIRNFATLAPAEFDRQPELCKQNFELLVQGGTRGIHTGLKILEALPTFKLGDRKILIVVDGLNLADVDSTTDEVRQLKAVLERIATRNRGHLLYTIAKQSTSYGVRM
ncbi:hypothetical protein O1611_g2386 [Lasiodiplodia mahajangana]|uniref:Uncharacterized protein n=1 Tax=Lasiodiplodia mahajangana TaxID=1108764 RepID=A0ACC2JUP2_9PEZI|nr:hypothetical protein O1611_g2386 [Lasiodiplodia mahajangana]